MIGRVLRFIAILLGLVAPASAEPATDHPIAGVWDVVSQDRALGRVNGWVKIAEDERSARVTLVHPVSGKEHILASRRFDRVGGRLTIDLEGAWPGAEGSTGLPFGKAISLADGAPGAAGDRTAALRLGKAEGTAAVQAPEVPESGLVTLEMEIGDNAISGIWEQRVIAETGRDPNGGGRIGAFGYAQDGTGQGIQQGTESWIRAAPEIFYSAVAADQMAIAEYLVPYHPDPWSRSPDSTARPEDPRRYIVVFGENLPTEIGEAVELESLSPGVSYKLQARGSDLRAGGSIHLDFVLADLERKSRLEIDGQPVIAPALLERLRDAEKMILRADLGDAVLPGIKGFTLNGAEGVWALRYGDYTADLAFVRPIGETVTDSISTAIAPEPVAIEVRSTTDLRLEAIPLIVGVEGQIRLLGGRREILAERVPPDPDALAAFEEEQARRRKLGLDPPKQTFVWRTPPLALVPAQEMNDPNVVPSVPPGSDRRIAVGTGSSVEVSAAIASLVELVPKIAVLNVAMSPAEVAAAEGTTTNNNLTWPRAVASAKTCAGIPVGPTDERLQTPVYTFSEWLWTEISWQVFRQHGYSAVADWLTKQIGLDTEWWFGRTDPDVEYTVNVMLGDHAAMLLLRDLFVERMPEQLAYLQGLDTDEDLIAFRTRLRPLLRSGTDHPIGDLEVLGPNGEPDYFFASFIDSYAEETYGLKGAALEAWRLQTTRQALSSYIVAVAEAEEFAAGVEACDIESLLELTAFGFDALSRDMLTRLVTDEVPAGAEGLHWRADRTARAYVQGLALLGGAVRALWDLNDADTARFQIALAVGTLIGGGGAYLLGVEVFELEALLFVLDLVDLAFAVRDEIFVPLIVDNRSVEFARGANAVLGPGRYQDDIVLQTEWYEVLPAFVVNALSSVGGIADAPRLLSQARQARLGKKLLGGAGDAMELAGEEVAVGRLIGGSDVGDTAVRAASTDDIDAAAFVRLSDDERNAIGFAMADAARLEARVGFEALTSAERRALALADAIRGPPGALPDWARGLDLSTYERLRPLHRRNDVQKLALEEPARLSKVLDEPSGFDVLRGEPFENIEVLEKAVAREAKRIKEPVPGVYDAAGPAVKKVDGYTIMGDGDGGLDIADTGNVLGVSDNRIFQNGQEVASYERTLVQLPPDQGGGKQIVLKYAKLEEGAPSFFADVTTPLVPGRGTPVTTFFNLRAFHDLKIAYADPDLTQIKLDNVLNLQNSAQIAWLEKTYGPFAERHFDRLYSVRYAETALNQAGFRIKRVRLDPHGDQAYNFNLSFLKRGFFRGSPEEADTMLKAYGLETTGMIKTGHNIIIDVEPIDAFDPNATAILDLDLPPLPDPNETAILPAFDPPGTGLDDTAVLPAFDPPGVDLPAANDNLPVLPPIEFDLPAGAPPFGSEAGTN